jgi:hypothetical protein
MNVEIWTETPIFLFWEYLFRIGGILSLQCGGEYPTKVSEKLKSVKSRKNIQLGPVQLFLINHKIVSRILDILQEFYR